MSWNEAFRAHLDLRHHLSAERTLDILAEGSKDSVAIESLRSELARQRQHWTAALRDQIAKVGNDVTRSAWYNLLPETTFLELKETVESLNPDHVLVFPEADKVLASVTLRLDEFKKQRRDDIRTRLARELPDATPELKSRIEHSLAQGHLLAANEYIDLAKEGQVPTPSGSTNVFGEYFPDFVRDVITHFQDERKAPRPCLMRSSGLACLATWARSRWPKSPRLRRTVQPNYLTRGSRPRFAGVIFKTICVRFLRVWDAWR